MAIQPSGVATQIDSQAGYSARISEQFYQNLRSYPPFQKLIQEELGIRSGDVQTVGAVYDRYSQEYQLIVKACDKWHEIVLCEDDDAKLLQAVSYLSGISEEEPDLSQESDITAPLSSSAQSPQDWQSLIQRIVQSFQDTQIAIAREHTKQIRALAGRTFQREEPPSPPALDLENDEEPPIDDSAGANNDPPPEEEEEDENGWLSWLSRPFQIH